MNQEMRMTKLRLELTLVDFAMGNQDYDVVIKTDVPTEAGPWMPTNEDFGQVLQGIVHVFRDLLEGLTGGSEGTNEDSNFYHERMAYFVDGVEIYERTSDSDAVKPDTLRVMGADMPVEPQNN
jgi:hypothetical protein